MKAMLSRLSQNCLKTGLKKSKVFKTVIVILIFSLQPPLLSGLLIEHSLYSNNNTISLVLTLEDFPINEVQQVFRTGQTSQIHYEVRLYREMKGFWSFLGDELIEEQSIVYNGRYDPFYDAYQIETPHSTEHYLQEETFFQAFRSNLVIFENNFENGRRFYIRARITFNPRKLMPPLNVLEPFLIDNQISTDWVQIPVTTNSRENKT